MIIGACRHAGGPFSSGRSAAASALSWGLKLFVRPPPAPPQAQLAEPAGALRGDLTRLLGADPRARGRRGRAEPAADARFQLVGVVSPRSAQAAREGLALIAVDGKPARAYRVGAVVDGANVLQSVSARGATLGPRDGAPVISLTLAPPAPAATGVLPPAAPRGSPALPVRPRDAAADGADSTAAAAGAGAAADSPDDGGRHAAVDGVARDRARQPRRTLR